MIGGREANEKDKAYLKARSKMVANVMMTLRKRSKLNVEALPTEDAISAYNYLIDEDRLVACALIPPEVVVLMESESSRTDRMFLEGKEFGDFDGEFDASGFDKEDLQGLSDDIKDYREFNKKRDQQLRDMAGKPIAPKEK